MQADLKMNVNDTILRVRFWSWELDTFGLVWFGFWCFLRVVVRGLLGFCLESEKKKKRNDCREKLEKDGKGRTFTWEIGRKERWGVKSKAENFESSCF